MSKLVGLTKKENTHQRPGIVPGLLWCRLAKRFWFGFFFFQRGRAFGRLFRMTSSFLNGLKLGVLGLTVALGLGSSGLA